MILIAVYFVATKEVISTARHTIMDRSTPLYKFNLIAWAENDHDSHRRTPERRRIL